MSITGLPLNKKCILFFDGEIHAIRKKAILLITQPGLYDWNMGTIDVFIRKIGENYYAVIKDETYPTLYWTTGKTIRIAKSNSLLGPYSEPSASVSPNFREAPMLIPSPNG